MRFVLAGAAVLAAAVPVSAFAVDYLTAEQAARLIFPEAERFESRLLALDAVQLQQLAGQGLRPRSARWTVQQAMRGGETLGHVVVDEVLGKYELISYAVGLSRDGSLRQIEILSYRESHGGEVRLPAWRRPFVGKTAVAPLRIGDDIANISGATLSCQHLTEGVRRIVAVVDMARRAGSL